jgi:predicted transcriptional regulator
MSNPATAQPASSATGAGYDWPKGRAMFESGVSSLTQIAKVLGCTAAAVSMRASRDGWVRDPLGVARLADERNAKLAASTKAERDRVIEITASMQSKVLVGHREDIKRARRVVSLLLDDLTNISTPEAQEHLDHLGDLLAEPDEHGNLDKLNKAYRKVISIGDRISGINTLSTALKTLIMLERQAFNIEGALVDPEATKDTADVVKGLDTIMAKFDAVLALQAPAPEPEIIIDVSRPVKEPAPARAV